MSLETAQRDLELYLDAQWAVTPKQFLNSDAGTTPSIPLSKGDDDFISVQVMNGPSRAAEIGAGIGGTKRSEGVLGILIHTERGAGARKPNEYSDTLLGLLEYKTIGSVTVESFTIAPGFPENKWFVTPVYYNFYFYR